MKLIQLFKTYSLKNFFEHKLLVLACLLSAVLAAGSTFFMLSISDTYKQGALENIQATNGNSQIKIQDKAYQEHSFTKKQQHHIDSLSKHITYTSGRMVKSNVMTDKRIDACTLKILIHPRKKDLVPKKKEVILDSLAAKRMNLQVGDKVFLKLYSKDNKDSYYKVSKILPPTSVLKAKDSEMELSEVLSGCGTIYLPNEKTENFVNIDVKNSPESKKIYADLKSAFAPHFSVRTVDQLKEKVWPGILFQLDFYKLVGSLTFIISGICISCAFLFFITRRLRDYTVMKVYGMKKRQLTGLLLIELFALASAGILAGLALGVIGIIGYLLWQQSPLRLLSLAMLLKNAGITSLLILLETAVFSLIPIAYVHEISFQQVLLGEKVSVKGKKRIVLSVLAVFTFLIVIEVKYSHGFKGLLYMLAIAIICLVIYLLTSFLVRLLSQIRRVLKNKYYLSFLVLKQSRKSIAASTTLFSLTAILVVAVSILPQEMTEHITGLGDTQQTGMYSTYYTNPSGEVVARKILQQQDSEYTASYRKDFALVSVNGVPLKKIIARTGKEKMYIPQIIDIFKNLHMNVFQHSTPVFKNQLVKGKWFTDQDADKKIFISNHYPSDVNIKKGDKLKLKIGKQVIEGTCGGVMTNTNYTKGLDACINQAAYPEIQMTKDAKVDISLFNQSDEKIIRQLLFHDPEGIYGQSSLDGSMVTQFLDDQKAFLSNLVVITIFSSLFLLFCVQLILNDQRRSEYQTEFEFGLSNTKLFKITLVEKLVLAFVQTMILFVFVEPMRLMLIGEFANGDYHFNFSLFLMAYLIVFVIHFGSYLLTKPKIGNYVEE